MDKDVLIDKLQDLGFSENIIAAFQKVPREDFVSEEFKNQAYEDRALPVGFNQTISQPYTIAHMLEDLDLKEGQKVLELGSGIGYVLALISTILGGKGEVYGVEIIEGLANKSQNNLKDYKNIEVYNRNGVEGLPEKAPFDRILISAACSKIPKKIVNQLQEDGLIVAPMGPPVFQSIITLKKEKQQLVTIREKPGFVFVPFIE